MTSSMIKPSREDLKQRVDSFKAELEIGSTVIFVLKIRDTKGFEEYLGSIKEPEDADKVLLNSAFSYPRFGIGIKLAQHLVQEVRGITKIRVYQSRLVIHMNPLVSDGLFLYNLFISKSILFLNSFFSNPEVLLEIYKPPAYEIINLDRYFQMIWYARRNRLLGSIYLDPPIPAGNRHYKHSEILQAVEDSEYFSWDTFPKILKYGATVNSTGQVIVEAI